MRQVLSIENRSGLLAVRHRYVINIHELSRYGSVIRRFAAGQPNLGGAVMGRNGVQPPAELQRNRLLLEALPWRNACINV